ncbi:hypothetical protein FACS1894217_05140 [Clostridia bacterium]|nr:hypothetical protein FACS1894217_05140 [Clostridia bacterium]
MNFAKNLIRLREDENLTQDQFADAFGVSRSAVGMWETGKREPDLKTLERITDFFKVDFNTLLNERW